ncbi:MAG: S26 family signal peptidase [Thermoplasmata archaeon]|nr:MAG: S26 family signal peptidase [Thermoplasmata archaeon]KAA0008383.1 MAG: S26 family signal peptidase [Thermoplasmata archaeon]
MENLQEKTIMLIRDVIIAIAIVGVILAALWAYTGQFPHTPMVVVTSSSMMHDNEPFGRIGTIDPGDLVLVKKVYSKNDIITRGDPQHPHTKHKTYGDYGDVIIYYPMGDTDRTPIIHRAICWVQKNSDDTYDVPEYGIHGATSVDIPDLHLSGYKPKYSGFITKGDNNEYPDQTPNGGICEQPVQLKWIVGKARGELPWFGLIKLVFPPGNTEGQWGYNGDDAVKIGYAVAPKDEWICLGISLFFIIVLPSSLDIYNFIKNWREKRRI